MEIVGKQFVLIPWNPGNTGKQSILSGKMPICEAILYSVPVALTLVSSSLALILMLGSRACCAGSALSLQPAE